MKIFGICIILSICIFSMTGCCECNKNHGVKPIYYDYGYNYDRSGYTERYRDHKLVGEDKVNEHRHEYVHYDYRKNNL